MFTLGRKMGEDIYFERRISVLICDVSPALFDNCVAIYSYEHLVAKYI